MKGGISLASTGYIQVRAYTSSAQIPLKDVAVNITDASGNSIAMRLTNRDGQLSAPVPIETPELSAGQQPNTGIFPYTVVNLSARLENYEEIDIDNLQVFPDTQTIQELEMIPLSEFPDAWNKVEIFDTSKQNL